MKHIRIFRSLSLLFTFLIMLSVYSVTAFAETPHQQIDGENLISTLNNYISVSSDGTLRLNIPESIKKEFDPAAISDAESALEKTNSMILNGQLESTKNGTLYSPDDKNEYIQGGNQSGYHFYWWGERFWFTHNQGKRFANALGRFSRPVSIAGVLIAAFGSGTGFLIGFGAGISIGGMELGWISNDMDKILRRNHGRGIIFDLNYWATYHVRTQ